MCIYIFRKTFYFNPAAILDKTGLIKSEELCVKKCPPGSLSTVTDIQNYHGKEGISYCRYDVLPAAFTSGGLCPKLPLGEQ